VGGANSVSGNPGHGVLLTLPLVAHQILGWMHPTGSLKEAIYKDDGMQNLVYFTIASSL